MFLWARADRLRPMRMVWPKRNYNCPKYSLIRWRKPHLREALRMDWLSGSKLDADCSLGHRVQFDMCALKWTRGAGPLEPVC
jgi:hypothetical protein